MSEETRGLAAALSKFQGDLKAVAKTKTAQIRSDKGNYSYKYADLGDVVAQTYPLLSQYGLAFLAKPTLNESGHLVLAYKLMHESGEFEGGEYPLPANGTPQQMGSAITYARRYAFCAITGAVSEEDDDGQSAPQERESTSRPRQRKAAEPPPDVDQTTGEVRMIDRGQLIELKTLESKLGKGGKDETAQEREDRMRFYTFASGEEVTSARGLTQRGADAVIFELRKRVPPEEGN